MAARGAAGADVDVGGYRSGRFHAGLDIKTWGQEGYPCIAVADGYVWRVRTSPWGYGKVVYLRLADGRTAVYAHLSRFAPAIDAVVREEQDRRGFYSVSLFLEPDRIPVSRGDVVAHTGSTGSGFPHLHFEIRDPDQRPLNPLTHGFSVEDTIPPTLAGFALIPQSADARVNGSALPQSFGLVWDETSDTYRGPSNIRVSGPVGVSLKVYDRADASVLTNRLAPYRVRLATGKRTAFEATYSAFSYDNTYLVDLDRSFELNRMGQRGFHNLYLQPGNDLGFYGEGTTVATGVLNGARDLRVGENTLVLEAEDAAGNRSVAQVVLRHAENPEPRWNGPTSNTHTELNVEAVVLRTHTVVVIRAPENAAHEAVLTKKGETRKLPVVRVDAGTWEAVVNPQVLDGGVARVDVRSETADPVATASVYVGGRRISLSGGELQSEDGRAAAHFKPGSVYAGFIGSVAPIPAADSLAQPVGDAYRFEPDTVPFADMVQVMLQPPEGTEKVEELGLYELTEKGWSFVWNDRDTLSGAVGAGVRHFSTYALLRDSVPPELKDLVPANGSSTLDIRPVISVGLEDTGSGIHEEENITMLLDGRALIFEYDPEENRAVAIPRRDLETGEHLVSVKVRDTNGNEATASSRFTVAAH